jgi:hypothetical protein
LIDVLVGNGRQGLVEEKNRLALKLHENKQAKNKGSDGGWATTKVGHRSPTNDVTTSLLAHKEVDVDLAVLLNDLSLKGERLVEKNAVETFCDDGLHRPDMAHHEPIHQSAKQLPDLDENVDTDGELIDFFGTKLKFFANMIALSLNARSPLIEGLHTLGYAQCLLGMNRVTLH